MLNNTLKTKFKKTKTEKGQACRFLFYFVDWRKMN